jgi:outer membrane autotransporter protein
LTVGSVTADQVQSGLGAKLAWAIDTRFGLEFRAAWLHDFINGAGETNAVLGGLSFTTTSARISPNGIRIGTGLTFYQSDATSLRLEYGGEFRDDYTAHGGSLQLSLKI